MSTTSKTTIGLACLIAVTAATTTAAAFDHRQTDTGATIKWPGEEVVFLLNEAPPANMPFETYERVIIESFGAWNHPASNLSLRYGGTTHEAGYGLTNNPTSNVVVLESDDWQFGEEVLAITLVSFEILTGNVFDADIVINGVDYPHWSTTGEPEVHDLANIMTHEAGHFVGLGHSDVRGTTMWPKAGAGETEKRTLHEDDVDGVIALYPTSYYRPEPERSFQDSPNTDTPRSAPRNGQESPTTEMPAQPTIRVTCSAATPGSAAPSSPVWLLGLGLLGLLALVRHRTNA